MQNEKIITVVTTLYNKAPYLETWAISVASQTYLDKTRIIVIDDGSCDGSVDLIKKYAAEYNIPIELYIHEENRGLTYTIMEAYHMLDTKYFTVLDADDYWLTPQKIEKAVNFLETHEDYSAYASNYFKEYKNGKVVPEQPAEMPSGTYLSYKDSPHYQTVSITFRNFFSPTLLASMDEFTKKYSSKYRDNGCNTDNFRHCLAFKFGKVYFENSFDGVFRCDIGASGTMSELAFSAGCARSNLDTFELYIKNFGLDDNCTQAFNISFGWYNRGVELLAKMLKDMTIIDFKLNEYSRKACRQDLTHKSDPEILFDAIIDYCNRLKEMGIRWNC